MSAQKQRSSKVARRKKVAKAGGEQYVFRFGLETDGRVNMRDLLGGKGANLAEMANIGLPVPRGFTLSTADLAQRAGLKATDGARTGIVTLIPRFGSALNLNACEARSSAHAGARRCLHLGARQAAVPSRWRANPATPPTLAGSPDSAPPSTAHL